VAKWRQKLRPGDLFVRPHFFLTQILIQIRIVADRDLGKAAVAINRAIPAVRNGPEHQMTGVVPSPPPFPFTAGTYRLWCLPLPCFLPCLLCLLVAWS
jgi:hypothetical protein